jgi:hypothetical protein
MGYFGDHIKGMYDFARKERLAHQRLDKRDEALPPIGAIDPESGKLVVGYRSRAGRLGKYLLLSERQVVYQSERISFVTLGFMGGKPMPDGKTGFDVQGDQIIRSEETDHAQGPVEDIGRGGNDPGPGGNPTPESGNCGAG